MTTAERASLQIAVLGLLRTKSELGMPEAALHTMLRALGQDHALPLLQAELGAMADARLVSRLRPLGATRWLITEIGEAKYVEAAG